VRFLGLEVTRAGKPAASTALVQKQTLSPVPDNRGWWNWMPWIVREPFAGAWQRDIEWTVDTVLAHHAVYACVTLISNDMGKIRPKLVVQNQETGIWTETRSSAFSPVLRKPNRYQNHIQFKEWWTTSKLLRGNTYGLKLRDERGVVVRIYILDPQRVQVLVAPDGSVFYKLGTDNLTGLQDVDRTVPASEIIHDRINCLFHPLVGVSPIFACGLAANMGLKILENATNFFGNGSNPSGIITAPATIPQATADRIKAHWEAEYSGENAGKVAVLGDGLEFKPMRMNAEDSQMIETLRFTAEMVCAAFHVPPWKIGVGTMPTYNNGELLNQIYYSDCLQSHIEQFELCMDEGLGLLDLKEGRQYGIELDIEALLRMDSKSLVETLSTGVKSGIHTPNEARRRFDLPPMPGGDTPYMQQQNYSLSALDRRDSMAPAPSDMTPPPSAPAGDDDEEEEASSEEERDARDQERRMQLALRFRLRAKAMAAASH
jgi:HK97 family phage portal protein